MRRNNRFRRCLWERRQTGTPAFGRLLWPEFPSGNNTCEQTNERTVIDVNTRQNDVNENVKMTLKIIKIYLVLYT
jgi:hypothetical protein